MRIRFITIGKTQEPWLQKGVACYEERLKHYCNFERIELPEVKSRAYLSAEHMKEQEGALLLKRIEAQDELILLDERGTEVPSEQLAIQLEKKMIHGASSLVFVAGGAYGFSPAVYAKAKELWALSRLTFSHQMVRVIFLEQLYRCFTIIKGEPYHHK